MNMTAFPLRLFVALALVVSLPGAIQAAKEKKPDKPEAGKDEEPSSKGEGQYGGFGGKASGGAGHPTVKVKNAADLQTAMKKGNVNIVIEASVIDLDKGIDTTASNITIDGQGCTIRGDKIPARGGSHVLKFINGKNLIVKNLRLRNGPDNISFMGAKDIVVDHVSSTGSGDDGISIAYGSENATITHCYIAGCTRAIFLKYKGTNRITVDHTVIMKNWIRAPLLVDVKEFDVRNNIMMDWDQHATNPSGKDCNGNVMGNLYIMHDFAHGKKHSAIYWGGAGKPGKVFLKDNGFRNCHTENKSTTEAPLPAPAIVPAYTTDLDKLEKTLMSETAGSGCMPRDSVDKEYLKATEWKVGHDTAFRIPKTNEALPK